MQSPYRHRSNPYPYYAQLRAQAPQSFNGTWFLASHEDVTTFLRSPDFSNRTVTQKDALLAQSFIHTDAPEHGRLRGIISDLFTAKATDRLKNGIRDKTLRLLNELKEKKKIELISDFAAPLSLGVVCDLIGIPKMDHQYIFSLYKQLYQPQKSIPTPGVIALRAYLRASISNSPGNQENETVLARLITAQHDGLLLESQVIENCIMLLIAGISAPQHLISTGMLTLLLNRNQMEILIEMPELIPQAIEEMLRHQPPTTFTEIRRATKTIQFRTAMIPEGARVVGLIGAANHDPAVFKDPDLFDIHRRPSKHLSFGSGIHQCIGNMILRKMAAIAFQELFHAFPTFRLRRGFAQLQPSYTWVRDAKTRGLRHLFLTY
jgi:cytochrome P450